MLSLLSDGLPEFIAARRLRCGFGVHDRVGQDHGAGRYVGLMANAVRFSETGGPEVLRWEELRVGEPGPGEVRIRHHAVGLNFADIYFRTGMYPAPLPSGIGVEAAGVIEAVGPDVPGFSVGDRVTYTGSPLGAYSTERVMAASHLIALDPAVGFESAAASTMRGLTTAYLLRRIHQLSPGDTVVLHAAAGGVGLLFCQWAKLLGIKVIGTVSSETKAEVARANGCAEVVVLGRDDLVERVRNRTGGKGVPVVYDSIGAATYNTSLDCLARRGLLVCFGTASGPVPPIDAMQLASKGSLFVTRPALADYIADPEERAELAGEFFGHVAAGRIAVQINQRYALRDAVDAHRELESGRSVGSSVLLP
ncbi:NADPH2:quinone reductase [Mycobacterium sp. OTB74]|nr:NADPH2:quinone reductase [Mycobacterium sp. OTB74]